MSLQLRARKVSPMTRLVTMLVLIGAFIALTASSVIPSTSAEASHRAGSDVVVRIVARLGDDGRVEFALQEQNTAGAWSNYYLFPRARFFPTTATVGSWLVSSEIVAHSREVASAVATVRISGRRTSAGRIEFALQQRVLGIDPSVQPAWTDRFLPQARFFPATATIGTWLVSTRLTISGLSPVPPNDTADRAALTAFYHATNGDNWRLHTNWLSTSPLYQWEGVTTDVDGLVVGLDLHSNRLSGSIPPEVGNLTYLTFLILDSNPNLSGSIPPEIATLTHLENLILSSNSLSGRIPPEIGGLSTLQSLVLNDNHLAGPIPPELADLSALTWLGLNGNDLTGCLPGHLATVPDLSVGSPGLPEGIFPACTEVQ